MIDPRHLDFSKWSGQTTLLIAAFGSIPIIKDERRWNEWARTVIALPKLSALGMPNPDGFGNWRDWAFNFNLKASILGL